MPQYEPRLLPRTKKSATRLIAEQLFKAMDFKVQAMIYEVMGTAAAPDREELAVRYLMEPVHAAQFRMETRNGCKALLRL